MFIVTYYLIYLNSYLEVYIIKYIYRIKKNIISININSNIFFYDIYRYSNLLFSSYGWIFRK